MAISDNELTVHDFMPEKGEAQEFMVSAGTALTTGASIAAHDDVIEALRTVFDPEIPVNIYDLGLVYLCDLDKSGGVTVEMTLTAPGCGMGPAIAMDAEMKIRNIPSVKDVQVEIVWEPIWDRDMMSDEAKLQLGMM